MLEKEANRESNKRETKMHCNSKQRECNVGNSGQKVHYSSYLYGLRSKESDQSFICAMNAMNYLVR